VVEGVETRGDCMVGDRWGGGCSKPCRATFFATYHASGTQNNLIVHPTKGSGVWNLRHRHRADTRDSDVTENLR